MTPAPYRTPTPPAAPRVRRRWVVLAATTSHGAMLVSFTPPVVMVNLLIAHALTSAFPLALAAGSSFVSLVAAWCAAFVRREVVS